VKVSLHTAQAFHNPFCIGQPFISLTVFVILACRLLTYFSTFFHAMSAHWSFD